MQLKIGNRVIEKYNNVTVSLRYDSVASVYSILVYFSPGDAQDRQTYIPGNFLPATLSYNGEVLISGVAISTKFSDSSKKNLTPISGYSKSGTIEDCQFPPTSYPLQFKEGPTLKTICEKLLNPFGLKVNIDSIVSAECNAPMPTQTMDNDETIKEFITKLAIGKNIVLSHDASGNLLLTRANTSKEPIFNFTSGTWTDMDLDFNGQQMHNPIWSVGQASIDSSNASEASIENPYVLTHVDFLATARLSTLGQSGVVYQTGYRPRVSTQTTGTDNTTVLSARQVLAQELKGIRLTIKIAGWTLNGKLVKPNNIVTVVNPDMFLYQKTRWFIESVDFFGDERSETAVLNCVLPECYNSDKVVNVFTGSNLTVAYSDPGLPTITGNPNRPLR